MDDEQLPLVGPYLDGLDVRMGAALGPSQHVTQVLVIMKVMDLDPETEHDGASIVLASSDLDWIERRGLISATQDILNATPFIKED